jgi:outer membrane murein-binding lipoprotein Lpp
MKRILLMTIVLAVGTIGRAQDAAVDERLNKLAGQVQDLADSKEALRNDLNALAKEVRDVRDQAGKPNDAYATQDDVKRLTEKLAEIDKKREDDKQLILDKIAELGKSLAANPSRHTPAVVPDEPAPPHDPANSHAASDKGYYYVIQSGDTLSMIAKAYRDKNIKVSVDDILRANDGLKAEKLIVGRKIFIPAPAP